MLNFGNKKKNESEARPVKAKGKDFFADQKEQFEALWVDYFKAADTYTDEDEFFAELFSSLWSFLEAACKQSYANGIATGSSRSRKQNR